MSFKSFSEISVFFHIWKSFYDQQKKIIEKTTLKSYKIDKKKSFYERRI